MDAGFSTFYVCSRRQTTPELAYAYERITPATRRFGRSPVTRPPILADTCSILREPRRRFYRWICAPGCVVDVHRQPRCAIAFRFNAVSPKIGIVYMHGTGSSPEMQHEKAFYGALREAGYLVETPEMCWSARRMYDRPYSDCMKAVPLGIAKLKNAGAMAIVVAGHSFGGNAAIQYGATHTDLLGVLEYYPRRSIREFSLATGKCERASLKRRG